MGGWATAFQKEHLDYHFGAQSMTAAPATWYVALYSVMPADDGTGGTEFTGGAYARQAVTNNLTEFPAASGSSPAGKTNANAVDYTKATAAIGTAVGYGLLTASTGGTPRWLEALDSNVVVGNGDDYGVAAGDMHLQHGDSDDTFFGD